jgi:hypothetical protein
VRAYVAITPAGLQNFLESGSFHVAHALVVVPGSSLDFETDLVSQEEREFELSWAAAEESRGLQGSNSAWGFVLAIDLLPEQLGQIEDDHLVLLSDILWNQVQSLLLAESEEEELSWFAAQEISTYLPHWMA